MEVKMNTTDRKGLVKAITEITETAATYKVRQPLPTKLASTPLTAIQHIFADRTGVDNLLQDLTERGYAHEKPSTRLTVELPGTFTDAVTPNLNTFWRARAILSERLAQTALRMSAEMTMYFSLGLH